MQAEKWIKSGQVTIIDVRTREEYMGGHVANSLNIPLQELEARLDEVKRIDTPIVLCCASGNRSGVATRFLLSHNVQCDNGGSWLNVNALVAAAHA